MKNTIANIVDKYLDDWVNEGLNCLPVGNIEPEMRGPNQDEHEEWKTWIPINSEVTDEEIEKLENTIGYLLPESYKLFLKHKHFYELQISEVRFCPNIVNQLQQHLPKMIFDGYPREYLIDKGFISFADYNDFGVLCFDTSKKTAGNEYGIVLWDHEIVNSFEPRYKNFTEMMIMLDIEAQNMR